MGHARNPRYAEISPTAQARQLNPVEIDNHRAAIMDEAIRIVRRGVPIQVASAAVGISSTTLYVWMRQDESFRVAIEQAQAQIEIEMIERASGLPAGPQGAQWWLERRRRDTWGKDASVIIDQRTQIMDVTRLTDEELRQASALARRATGEIDEHSAIPDAE